MSTYEVTSPLGMPAAAAQSISSRVRELEGKRIGIFWNGYKNGDVLSHALEELLTERFKGLRVIELASGERPWGNRMDKKAPERAREARVDAAIGVAGC
ncbi:MAG: hypothetical protein HY665_05945 [Chloroflexi bacterium]|nr:hypothetical protein [Chloroflexota bacterium]